MEVGCGESAAGYPSPADDAVAVVEYCGLPGCDGAKRFQGADRGRVIRARNDLGRVTCVAVADLHGDLECS